MDTSIDYYILSRLAPYIEASVKLGSFILPETLFQRFEKTTKLRLGCERQRKRYLAALKENCSSSLRFVLIRPPLCKRKKLHVTSIENSHFDDNYDEEAPFAQMLLKALQTTQVTAVKVYEVLLASTNFAKTSLEKIIKKLKLKAEQFGLIFFKVGRELQVELKYPYNPVNNHVNNSKNRPKNTPLIGDFPCRVLAKDKELLRNTPSGDFRLINEARLRKKAFWLAKKISTTHFYDNCKVKCCMPMLFKFVLIALKNGFEDRVIEGNFRRALLVRHADATDMGLNRGIPGFKFEMSSTVTLAYQYLKEQLAGGICDRWENLLANVFPKREAAKTEAFFNSNPNATTILSQIKTMYPSKKTETETQTEVKETIPHSAEGTAENDRLIEAEAKAHAEEMAEWLDFNKFTHHDIQIFKQFQKRQIPAEIIHHNLNKIVKMGIILSNAFPDHKDYEEFRQR